jgi:hypothetical protein
VHPRRIIDIAWFLATFGFYPRVYLGSRCPPARLGSQSASGEGQKRPAMPMNRPGLAPVAPAQLGPLENARNEPTVQNARFGPILPPRSPDSEPFSSAAAQRQDVIQEQNVKAR